MFTKSIGIAVLIAVLSAAVHAQPFDLSWHTIDGGGAMFSTGGAFSLGGTIGQPDASSHALPMTGGAFSLVGGFWVDTGSACFCPGDLNADGARNGRDIQQFTGCLVSGGACACADVDGVPGVTVGDISVFVADLLAGSSCP